MFDCTYFVIVLDGLMKGEPLFLAWLIHNPSVLEHPPIPISPIITVGQPSVIDPPWVVGSPMRAAIMYSIFTVGEPIMMESGGPTQVHMSPIRAAGIMPIMTVAAPIVIGPPTCGTGGVPGVTIGQTCRSVIRAAGGIFFFALLVSARPVLGVWLVVAFVVGCTVAGCPRYGFSTVTGCPRYVVPATSRLR